MSDEAIVTALNRLAQAIEQNTLALLDAHAPPTLEDGLPMGNEEPPLPPPPPEYATVPGQFPPIGGPVVSVTPPAPAQVVSPIPPQPQGLCPEHHVPWSKLVPAGVSKRSGQTYPAFWACPAQGCKQKPPR